MNEQKKSVLKTFLSGLGDVFLAVADERQKRIINTTLTALWRNNSISERTVLEYLKEKEKDGTLKEGY